MPPAHIVLILLAGALAGFINTLASSGSAVTLPLLVFLGFPPAVANGTNRINVLTGALTSMLTFHRSGVLDWRNGLILTAPTALGALAGASIAGTLDNHTMRWVITVAVLIAFVMVLFCPSRWLLAKSEGTLRLGRIQMGMFFLIGAWTGFIVLDSATYMLIALTLGVGYELVHANAVKSVLLLACTIASLVVFARDAEVNWTAGTLLATGSIVGACGAARIAVHEWSKIWVYRLLVVVILAEMIRLVPDLLR